MVFLGFLGVDGVSLSAVGKFDAFIIYIFYDS
jgi:hypothetical protein